MLQSLWLAKSPLTLYAVSPSLTRNASWIDIVLSLSLSRSFWPRLSSALIGSSMAPLVPRGMLRTSIILPDPAGFTDTSQEQMNASHFDGFMNILHTLRAWRTGREDLLFSSRSSFYIAWVDPLLIAFLPESRLPRAPGTETESP